jgi:predicted dinucleotide-binding enzyme
MHVTTNVLHPRAHVCAAGELLASALPEAHVYKAFNHIPVEQMVG